MNPGRGSAETDLRLDSVQVERLVLGVFEGGGAKGVLYVGALEALLERKLWFSAVAGSSAGAITAAMVAAGMGPEEIDATRQGGLDALALPNAFRGLWRVGRGTGFLDRERVRVWLRDVLRTRSHAGGPHDPSTDRGPTFRELFERSLGGSGMDLYVVAVDLRARNVMVFNHALTPDCPVADAVTASATIPVAFEPLVFQTTEEQAGNRAGEIRWRFVADGGLASNFPDFVFHDEGFRTYAGLPPRPMDVPIVGFLLEEAVDSPEDVLELYGRGSFVGSYSELQRILKELLSTRDEGPDPEKEPKERQPRARASEPSPPSGLLRRLGRWIGSFLWGLERLVLLPIGLLGIASQGKLWPWRWPEPKNRHAGLWLGRFRQSLTTALLQTVAGPVIYTAMFWTGFVLVTRSVLPNFGAYDLDDWESLVTLAFSLVMTFAVVVLAAWVWLLGVGAFLLLRVSYRTVGLLGRDVLRAFLQAPAAPPWAGCRPGETVVRLPVPTGITTLGVEPGTELGGAIADAREAASQQLERLVRGLATGAWREIDEEECRRIALGRREPAMQGPIDGG